MRLGQQRRRRERPADGLAQPAGVDLEGHAGRRHGAQRRGRGGRDRLLVLRRPELARRGRGGRRRRRARLSAACRASSRLSRWMRSQPVVREPPHHLGMIEAEAVADDVDGADDVVERVLLEGRGRQLERLGDEVGLDAEDDAHVARVLARQVQDERDVVVQLVRPHRPVVGEVVQRLPAAEERQVVGEPHLRHPELDGALDVLARLTLRVTAQASVDVVVGDHERLGGRRSATRAEQAYTRRRAPAARRRPAPRRRRANSSTSSMPATNPPRWAKNATPASPDPNDCTPPMPCSTNQTSEQDPGRHLEHRPDDDERDHGEDPGAREQHEVPAEDAGDRAAGADERHVARGSDEHLRRRRRHAADDVEDDEPRPRHGVLDVVAEDPQVPHVEEQVQPAAVHEQGREQGGPPREPAERRHVHVVVSSKGRAPSR